MPFLQNQRLSEIKRSSSVLIASLAIGISVISESLLLLSSAILAMLIGYRWLRSRRFFRRTPSDPGILLLATLAFINLAVSVQPERSVPQVLRLLSGILLYYYIAEWNYTPGQSRAAFIGISIAGIGLATLALISVDWSESKLMFFPEELYSLFPPRLADVIHPNVMAGILVLSLPMPIAAILFGSKRAARWELFLWLLAALLGSAVLLLSKSRAGLAAFAASIAVLALLRWRRAWIIIFALAFTAALLLAVYDPDGSILLSTNTRAGPFEMRVEIWSRGLDLVQAFPLVSAGMGMYGPLVDRFFPLFLNTPGSVLHAHNLFLQIAVDLGLPGLVAWLSILLVEVWSAWYVLRCSKTQTWCTILAAGLLASQTSMIVHGLADSVTWGMVRTAPFVWVIWGLVAGCLLQSARMEEHIDGA